MVFFFSKIYIFSNYFLEEKKGPEHLKWLHSPEAICNGSFKDTLGRVGFRSEAVQYRTTLEWDQGSDIAESKDTIKALQVGSGKYKYQGWAIWASASNDCNYIKE